MLSYFVDTAYLHNLTDNKSNFMSTIDSIAQKKHLMAFV